MVRVNYGFKDKYLLTASMRWDGASQLAPGHKWAVSLCQLWHGALIRKTS